MLPGFGARGPTVLRKRGATGRGTSRSTEATNCRIGPLGAFAWQFGVSALLAGPLRTNLAHFGRRPASHPAKKRWSWPCAPRGSHIAPREVRQVPETGSQHRRRTRPRGGQASRPSRNGQRYPGRVGAAGRGARRPSGEHAQSRTGLAPALDRPGGLRPVLTLVTDPRDHEQHEGKLFVVGHEPRDIWSRPRHYDDRSPMMASPCFPVAMAAKLLNVIISVTGSTAVRPSNTAACVHYNLRRKIFPVRSGPRFTSGGTPMVVGLDAGLSVGRNWRTVVASPTICIGASPLPGCSRSCSRRAPAAEIEARSRRTTSASNWPGTTAAWAGSQRRVQGCWRSSGHWRRGSFLTRCRPTPPCGWPVSTPHPDGSGRCVMATKSPDGGRSRPAAKAPPGVWCSCCPKVPMIETTCPWSASRPTSTASSATGIRWGCAAPAATRSWSTRRRARRSTCSG